MPSVLRRSILSRRAYDRDFSSVTFPFTWGRSRQGQMLAPPKTPTSHVYLRASARYEFVFGPSTVRGIITGGRPL